MLAAGPQKTGKNHFGFTAPDPIFCQSIDDGCEGVVEKFVDGRIAKKDIDLSTYHIDISEDDAKNVDRMGEAAEIVWNQWVADYLYALKNARTVIWDTETDAWALLRLARFGVLNPPSGRDRGNIWGPVNAEYTRLLRMPLEIDVNFIMLQKVKDEYKNDKKTGGQVRAGFSDAAYIAQVVVQARRVGKEFSLYIEDCRDNPELNEFETPDNSFETLKGLVLEG